MPAIAWAEFEPTSIVFEVFVYGFFFFVFKMC